MRPVVIMVAAVAAVLPSLASDALLKRVDSHAERFGAISRKIWESPELGFAETKSAALLAAELKAAGFRVKEGVAGMPTAFTAEWGEGKPVIAVIGEYDALPGLSQADVPEKRARVEGAPGHGCGHNLFGAATALAAVALKEQMVESGWKGTLRFYGTPAEEGGGGKIFMIRAGLFDDVDLAVAWHPADFNAADNGTWLANVSARLIFKGKAAHAAASPEEGRSALDAVELTAHAVNMLREHVPQETRIHYYIANGGVAANIVPESAEMRLIARNPDLATLERIWARVLKCAEAGALATETSLEVKVTSAYANMISMPSMVSLLDRSLQTAGGVVYDAKELEFFEKLKPALEKPRDPAEAASIRKLTGEAMTASTDVGDLSWVVPTAHFMAATFYPGTPLHSWQSTACAGTSAARKGMVVAAKGMAVAAGEVFANPSLAAAAKREHAAALKGRAYKSLLPAAAKPAIP